jgi:hypothetical protein
LREINDDDLIILEQCRRAERKIEATEYALSLDIKQIKY